MVRMKNPHIGFDTILNIWNSGHDIIEGGDICNDGFLIWMRHIHICKERSESKVLCICGGRGAVGSVNLRYNIFKGATESVHPLSVSSLTLGIQKSGHTQFPLCHAECLLQVLLVALTIH